MRCVVCGSEFTGRDTGRPRVTCGQRCRKRLSRLSSPFPARMTHGRRWTRAEGKRPVQVDGSPASSTDPGMWSTFAQVQSGAGDGFGVMLGEGLACIDIDHCLNGGVLAPWAVEVVESESPLFVEVSMSGTGLHVFVESPEGPGLRRGGVERYSRARFIRCTGDVFVR